MFIGMEEESQTFKKVRNEAMRRAVNQIAVPSNADGRKNIVARTHDFPNIGIVEFVDHLGSRWLQFVFEDYETQELKIRLGILTLHLACLCPA